MKKILFVSVVLVLLASLPVYGDSFVRVQCEDEDAGAEVFLNDKFVGECPVDAPVKEGTVQLRARKIVDDDHEKVFEKKLRVVEGVSQRVELVMSAPQLTAKARQRKAAAEAAAQLKAAQAGDIDAMKQLAERYDAGAGVKKDPAQAAIWRDMAESAAAQEELRAANAGDIEAMKNIAGRYDTGLGVVKDHSQAQAWRAKADAKKRENNAQADAARREAKELNKQQRLDRYGPFKEVKKYVNSPTISSAEKISQGPTTLPFITVSDILSLPCDLTERSRILNEAALRPSSWGKPDSMIAQASFQQKAKKSAPESSLFIAAVQ